MKSYLKNHQAGFTLIEVIVTLVLASVIAAMLSSFFGTSLTRSGEPIQRLMNSTNLQQVMENIVSDYNRLNALNSRYKWQPSINYRNGVIVTPKTIPASPNGGHYYKGTTAGTSGATEPSWPTANGSTVTDGSVTWKESGNIIWQKRHPYTAGAIIVPINNNGHYYKCTVAGTSGATEPSWKKDNGITVTDGSVTWTEAGSILDSADTTNIILKDNLKYYLTNDPTRYGNGYSVVAEETKFIKFNAATNIEEAAGNTDEKCNLKVTIKDNNSGRTLTTMFTIH